MIALPKIRQWIVSLCVGVFLLPSSYSSAQTNLTPWSFSTLAGSKLGEVNATGTNASFNAPHGIALDSSNNIYVGDYVGGTVRKISPAGAVTTIASGLGSDNPVGVCVDTSNNVYCVCNVTDDIVKIATNGTVTVFASGLDSPNDIVTDVSNNIFLTEFGNNAIYKITPTGTTILIAGLPGNSGSADGTNETARFNHPWGVAVDASENLYISDSTNCTIRMVSPSGTNWVVTTIAGQAGNGAHVDGIGTNALFDAPTGITVDSGGNLYVCDRINQCVRKLARSGLNWTVTTIGNVIATPVVSGIVGPRGIVVDGADNLYIADPQTETIQKAVPVLAIYTFPPDFGFVTSQFGFDFGGPPGESVIIEATTDLINWTPLLTNSINIVSNHLTDVQSNVLNCRFYRLRAY